MTDWIEWKGGECPVPYNADVVVRFASGDEIEGVRGDEWCWGWDDQDRPSDYHIIAYRVVQS